MTTLLRCNAAVATTGWQSTICRVCKVLATPHSLPTTKYCSNVASPPPRPFPTFNLSKQNEREIHLTTHANATHLLSTRPMRPHDTMGAPTTNILTLFPRWLPLVVIFVVSRETLFGMNLSIISGLSGIVDSCALLENDDSAQIQRCSGDHRMAKYDFPCLQSSSNVSLSI